MAQTTKQSRFATVVETTENTAKAPTTGSDFLAIQDGFETALVFETLENSEIKSSIAPAQTLTGFESPTATISHYLRHSGTEGVAPQDGYSNLLRASYGEEVVRSSELTAAAASTTTTVKLADTSTYRIGDALLVKHATFDHEIRVISDIPNSTDLTMLFALDNAPVVGTSLGKNVTYRAVDSDHPSLTLWDYRANGGALAVIAGSRVTSFTMTADAGGLINKAYELGGLSSFFNPLEVVDGSNDDLDYKDSGSTTFAVTISARLYETPIALASAIQTAMNGTATIDSYTVTYSNTTGKYTIVEDGSSTFELLWKTGVSGSDNTDTHIGTLIGFDDSADDTGASTYTSDSPIDLSTGAITPSFDSPGTPLVAKNQEIFIGTQSDNICFSTQTVALTMGTPKTDELDVCSGSGKSGSIINERVVTATMTANLPQFKADLFEAFRNNTSVGFEFNFGTRDGSNNWEAGKSGTMHIKDASVTTHNLGDNDGLVTLLIEIAGFADATGNSETSLNLL